MTTLAPELVRPDQSRVSVRSHRGLLQVATLLWVYALYDELRTHVAGAARIATRHAHQLFSVERTLGLSVEHTVQAAALAVPGLALACTVGYTCLHLVVPPVVLFALYRYAPDRYRHWRNVFVAMLGLAVLCFWLYPVMPPRLVAGAGHLADPSTLYFSLTKTPFAHVASATAASSPSMTGATNPFAAMPSLHVGWAIWAALAVWPLVRRRWLRALIVVYPVFMAVSVIVTANHWMLDALAGAVLVLLAHFLARLAETVGARAGARRTSVRPA